MNVPDPAAADPAVEASEPAQPRRRAAGAGDPAGSGLAGHAAGTGDPAGIGDPAGAGEADGSGLTGHAYTVLTRAVAFRGAIFDVVADVVSMPGGGTAPREYVRNLGAAAVVALDDGGRVVLVRQYRHAVGRALWELPAGLIDVDDGPPVRTAQRELAEEVDLVAASWHALVDLHPSPGMSDELIAVFLARDLSAVPEAELHRREHEEAELRPVYVELDEAVAMVLRGEITNAAAVAGLLATARARDLDWAPLREAR